MRLVTLRNSGNPAPGVVVNDAILSIAACGEIFPEARCVPASVRGILEGGDAALGIVRRILERATATGGSERHQLEEYGAFVPSASAELLAPIPDPHMVLSCGMNYRAHLAEMGGPMPARPAAFLKSVNAIIGPDAPIRLPKSAPDMVDWEAEFCGVIGRTCHNVSAKEALDYVAGYTMINDVSARNWVKPMGQLVGLEATQAWDQNLLGKQFPTFCPMGPAIATKDEISDPNKVSFELKLNGKVMQSANTDDLAFDLAALVSFYSQFYIFRPGDVITTGSPAGVGMGRKPWVFLKAGDVVEIRADGSGSMKNPVEAST